MTNEKAMQFLKYRATKYGILHKLIEPTFCLIRLGKRIAFAIKYANLNDVFIVGFYNHHRRMPFLLPIDISMDAALIAKIDKCKSIQHDNIDTIPSEIQAIVTKAIISVLKNKTLGLDCMSVTHCHDISLISQNESYEEAMIEIDLMIDNDSF